MKHLRHSLKETQQLLKTREINPKEDVFLFSHRTLKQCPLLPVAGSVPSPIGKTQSVFIKGVRETSCTEKGAVYGEQLRSHEEPLRACSFQNGPPRITPPHPPDLPPCWKVVCVRASPVCCLFRSFSLCISIHTFLLLNKNGTVYMLGNLIFLFITVWRCFLIH